MATYKILHDRLTLRTGAVRRKERKQIQATPKGTSKGGGVPLKSGGIGRCIRGEVERREGSFVLHSNMWGVLTQALTLAQGVWTPFHHIPGVQTGIQGKNVDLYTGPYASGGAWASAYDHAVDLVSQMTIEEKVSSYYL